MTFQWAAVASFLYAEIAILLFLCIPTISPLRWQKIFMFSLWSKIANYGNKAFLAIIILLIVLFLDAVREVRKYSGMHITEKSAVGRVNPFDHIQMKLFRAQRNLYISGFSLFLWLILRRTISLIIQLAGEMRAHITLETQVAETSEAARQSLVQNEKLKESLKIKNGENDGENDGNLVETNKKLKQEIEELKRELQKSKNALNKKAHEITAFKKQYENLGKEYDDFSEAHKRLQESEDEKQKKVL